MRRRHGKTMRLPGGMSHEVHFHKLAHRFNLAGMYRNCRCGTVYTGRDGTTPHLAAILLRPVLRHADTRAEGSMPVGSDTCRRHLRRNNPSIQRPVAIHFLHSGRSGLLPSRNTIQNRQPCGCSSELSLHAGRAQSGGARQAVFGCDHGIMPAERTVCIERSDEADPSPCNERGQPDAEG